MDTRSAQRALSVGLVGLLVMFGVLGGDSDI
jgi:hypothetical protein